MVCNVTRGNDLLFAQSYSTTSREPSFSATLLKTLSNFGVQVYWKSRRCSALLV